MASVESAMKHLRARAVELAGFVFGAATASTRGGSRREHLVQIDGSLPVDELRPFVKRCSSQDMPGRSDEALLLAEVAMSSGHEDLATQVFESGLAAWSATPLEKRSAIAWPVDLVANGYAASALASPTSYLADRSPSGPGGPSSGWGWYRAGNFEFVDDVALRCMSAAHLAAQRLAGFTRSGLVVAGPVARQDPCISYRHATHVLDDLATIIISADHLAPGSDAGAEIVDPAIGSEHFTHAWAAWLPGTAHRYPIS